MPFLKLHSYEPEAEPPAPLPFHALRENQRGPTTEEESMDSIAHAKQALEGLQEKIDDLTEQVEEYFDPIQMSLWMSVDGDDDGPWAA